MSRHREASAEAGEHGPQGTGFATSAFSPPQRAREILAEHLSTTLCGQLDTRRAEDSISKLRRFKANPSKKSIGGMMGLLAKLENSGSMPSSRPACAMRDGR